MGRSGTIGSKPVRRQQRLILQHLADKPLRGIKIALGCEEKIDRIAMFVDGPVKIAPLATDLDIGFVDPDRATMRLAEETQSLLDQGRIRQTPSIDGAVIDFKSAFQDRLLDIPVTQRIAQIPTDS
jgi:hypothetical protein